jgi:hypothetical protein
MEFKPYLRAEAYFCKKSDICDHTYFFCDHKVNSTRPEMSLRNRIRGRCGVWLSKVGKGAALSRYRIQFNLCRDQSHLTQRLQNNSIRVPILNRLTGYGVATGQARFSGTRLAKKIAAP